MRRSEVTDLSDTARSFREAARVAEATPPGQPLPPELGRLIDHDTQHGSDLLTTLRHYLDAAGNKTIAARRSGLSRETMYQRLRAIERLLDRDLESGDQRTELHVALAALDALRAHRT